MLKIIKKEYKTNLTLEEINTINSLRSQYDIFESTKLNMMSVLSYLVKHGSATVEGFKKSLKDLWDMYKRYHKNIKSLSTFRDVIYKLKEHKLISIEKSKKVNLYFSRDFIKIKPKDKPLEKPKLENQDQSTDMTGIKGGEENTQIQNPFGGILDIDVNNQNDENIINSKKPFRKSKTIEKCKSFIKTIKVAKEVLEDRNITNKWVSNRVIVIISHVYKNVSVRGLRKYINKLINQAIYLSQQNYKINAYYNNKAINKARNNAKPSTFANFTQREYDYEKLEKQLLGWDDEEEQDNEDCSNVDNKTRSGISSVLDAYKNKNENTD